MVHEGVFDGHFYEYYADPLPYQNALDFVKTKKRGDASGYLAVVTSDVENTFIGSMFRSSSKVQSAWLGGQKGGAGNSWAWNMQDTGAAIHFWQGDATGKSVASSYQRWNYGEPNNLGGLENCLSFQSGLRKWNDYNCLLALGYVVEYSSDEKGGNTDITMGGTGVGGGVSNQQEVTTFIPGTSDGNSRCGSSSVKLTCPALSTLADFDGGALTNSNTPVFPLAGEDIPPVPTVRSPEITAYDYTKLCDACADRNVAKCGFALLPVCATKEGKDAFESCPACTALQVAVCQPQIASVMAYRCYQWKKAHPAVTPTPTPTTSGGDSKAVGFKANYQSIVCLSSGCEPWMCCANPALLAVVAVCSTGGGHLEQVCAADQTILLRDPNLACTFSLCPGEVPGQPYPPLTKQSGGLTMLHQILIAVGCFVFCVLCGALLFCMRRKDSEHITQLQQHNKRQQLREPIMDVNPVFKKQYKDCTEEKTWAGMSMSCYFV